MVRDLALVVIAIAAVATTLAGEEGGTYNTM